MRVIAPTPFPGAHTRPAPAHAAAISDVLTRASFPRERSRAALEDGTRISAGRLDTSARIALLTPSGHRVALLAVTGSLAEPAGGALLGTAVASAFRLGPEHPDDRPPSSRPPPSAPWPGWCATSEPRRHGPTGPFAGLSPAPQRSR